MSGTTSKEAMISEECCEVTPRDLDQKLKSWSRILIVLSHIGVYTIFLKKGFLRVLVGIWLESKSKHVALIAL